MAHNLPHTSEAKRLISEKMTGRVLSITTKLKMSRAKKGRYISIETRTKTSAALKGQYIPLKTRLIISNTLLGMSDERSAKLKGRFVGDKHPCWRGGLSFLPYSPEFTDRLKQSIRERDDNQCQNTFCNHTSKRLISHHIDYNKQNSSPINLITLCNSCNALANVNRAYWTRLYNNIICKKVFIGNSHDKFTLKDAGITSKPGGLFD